MYLAKQMTSRSLPEIGRRFGGRDHTTIMHGVRKIEELRAQDRSLAEDIDLLRRTTPMRFFWAKEYSDYHPELPGGSAAGRTCECRPLDTAVLGEHRSRLRPGVMEVKIPMPTTGADYRWLNLMSRVPRKGVPVVIKRLGQGVPVFGVLGHSRGHDLVEPGWELVAQLRRAGCRLVDVSPHQLHEVAGVRRLAGQQLVEQASQGVDVHPVVAAPGESFGGHVAGGAGHYRGATSARQEVGGDPEVDQVGEFRADGRSFGLPGAV